MEARDRGGSDDRVREINQTRRRAHKPSFPIIKVESRSERAEPANRKLPFQRPTAKHPFCSISPIFRRLCIGLSIIVPERRSLVLVSNSGALSTVFMSAIPEA